VVRLERQIVPSVWGKGGFSQEKSKDYFSFGNFSTKE